MLTGHWWVTDYLNAYGAAFVVSWVFWIILSIVLHELAHGWMAIRCGDETPRLLGHMTWNPVVHMGVMSLLLFALVGITWGLMPINPSNFRRRRDEAWVALAGPMMNVAIAIVAFGCSLAWRATGCGDWYPSMEASEPTRTNVHVFFTLGAMLNVVLALFNLIPVPPLDGSKIAANFVPPYRRVLETEGGLIFGLVVFVIVFNQFGPVLFEAATNWILSWQQGVITAWAPARPITP